MENLIWQSCLGSLVIKSKSKDQETVSPCHMSSTVFFIAQNLSEKSSPEPHIRVRTAANGKC